MGFKTKTPHEAYVKVMHAWIPVIDILALNLGVNLQSRDYRNHRNWDEYHNKPYHEVDKTSFSRHYMNNARDRVVFLDPARIPHCKLLSGKSETLGEEPGFASVLECDNRDGDEHAHFEVEFVKGFTAKESSAKTRKEGWSFENEFKVGAEYSGVSFENTTTIGAHGEYERMKGIEKESTDSITTKVMVSIPPGEWYKIEQYRNKAQIEVSNLEIMSFDIAFDIYCDNNLLYNLSYLKDNKRIQMFPGTKHSYRMLSINSSDDLYELLVGINSDYPHQRQNLLESNETISRCYDFLADEDKWSIESEEKILFDNAQHGVIRVKNMTADNVFVDAKSIAQSSDDANKLEELAAA